MNGNAVKQELARLGDELLADAALPAKVKAFLHLWKYDTLASEAAGAAEKGKGAVDMEVRPVNVGSTNLFPKTGRAMSPERQHILNAAREIVSAFGDADTPIRTADIFDTLPENLRSRIVGIDPKSSLSAMLSNSPWFESHGRRGWTLREVRPEENVVYEVEAPGHVVEVTPAAA